MGCTLQELGERMSAQEFGLHEALDTFEPMPRAQAIAVGSLLAAVANGELKAPQPGRLWKATDFVGDPWAPEPEMATPAQPAQTVEQIMAAARAAGMQ